MALAPGVKRFNDDRKLRLGNEAVHLLEKLFPAGGFTGLLETFVGKDLLAYSGSPRQEIIKCDVDVIMYVSANKSKVP